MEWYFIVSAFILGAMVLAALGMPVAIAFVSVNLVAAFTLMGGDVGIQQVIYNSTQSISTFALIPVALFILMGELFFRTGLATRVFDAVELLMGRVPGRLSFVAVSGGTIFATLSGSSMANTAMMGTTLAPTMFEKKYHPNMVYGPIMGAGCIAALIPPSSLAVLLATLGNMNIGNLLIGGIIPGLIIAAAYMALIGVQVVINPDHAPAYDVEIKSWRENFLKAMGELLPMGTIVFAVIGLLVMGVATPTESSAFGVVAVLLVALFKGRVELKTLITSLVASARSTSLLLIILLSSAAFAQLLSFSGASSEAVKFALSFDLGTYEVILMMLVVLLILGMFVDQTSMMMITFPIFLPLVAALKLDMIWFGVMVLITLEMSLITPPLGLLLFVMMGVAPKNTSYWEIIRAAIPYFFIQLAVLLAVVYWPQIVTWLPSKM